MPYATRYPSLKAAATAQPMQETTAGGGRGRLLPGPAERTEALVNARDVDTGPVVLDFDTTDVVKSTLLEQPYATSVASASRAFQISSSMPTLGA